MKSSAEKPAGRQKATRAAVVTAVVGAVAALSVVLVLHTSSRRVVRDLQQLTPQFTLPSVTAPVQQSTSGVPDPRYNTTEAPQTAAAPTAPPDTETATEEKTTAAPTTTEPQTAQTIQNTAFFPPVDGKVCKPFSPKKPLFSATMGDWRTHSGIDFAAEDGSEVHAVGNGVVTHVTSDARRGYVIEIDHGTFTARYCSLSQDGAVRNGASVAAGDVIGRLATPPDEQSDAAHLHFEVLRDGAYIDPLQALGLG